MFIRCIIAIVALNFLATPGASAADAELEILSLDHNGHQVIHSATRPFVSADGRFTVFQASFLLPEDTTGGQIYLRDRETGGLELISVNTSGVSASTGCELPWFSNARAISDDGRFVVFRSTATDLVDGVNTGGVYQVYLRDRQTGTTSMVSVDDAGNPANGSNEEFTLSPEGTHIMFNSAATNLDANDTDPQLNTYMHETILGDTRLACFKMNGEKINGCTQFSLSCGGGVFAFRTVQHGVAPGDFNAWADVYVGLPFSPGDAELLTRNWDDVPADNGNHGAPALSCDGSRIAFGTRYGIVFGDDNNDWDLYVRNWVSGQVFLIEPVPGTAINTTETAFNTEGGWLAFTTSTAIDSRDTNNTADIYLLDFRGDTPGGIRYISHNQGAPSNLGAHWPAVSNNGEVVFESASTNLTGVPDTNGQADVFGTIYGWIFADGFESGDVGAWAGTAP